MNFHKFERPSMDKFYHPCQFLDALCFASNLNKFFPAVSFTYNQYTSGIPEFLDFYSVITSMIIFIDY